MKTHAAEVSNIDGISFGKELKGYLALGQAKNQRTKAKCFLADFGCGVSQFLPVLVQGALMRKGDTLMVEQPEAHLHSSAQLPVGSFFASLWRDRGVRSIVETHSPNILLRLRRLIANGKLKPEDVGVAYFPVQRGASRVKNLSVGSKGQLEKGLPMEFFGADLLESLEMGAGR